MSHRKQYKEACLHGGELLHRSQPNVQKAQISYRRSDANVVLVMLLGATECGATAVLVKKGLYTGGCMNLWYRVCLWISTLTHTDLCLLRRMVIMAFIVHVCVCLEGKYVYAKLCTSFSTRISNLITTLQ